MTTILIHTDGRPLHATQAVLSTYLPPLAVTLTALDGRRALVDDSIWRALREAYGLQGQRGVLHAAGILQHEALSDEVAQTLLDVRAAQPDRPALQLADPVGDHLRAVRAPQAWQLLGGVDAIDWTGVRVGHIDTGWTRHPALGFADPRGPWVVVADGTTDFAPTVGDPFSQPGPGQGEDALTGGRPGHGTRTAAVICGHSADYRGVAPRVPVVPVRVADHVWINHAQPNVARAIRHLVDHAGVVAINISLGAKFAITDPDLKQAVNHAYERGVIVVCAAGQPLASVVVPARLSRTVALAGVDNDGHPWTQSARGATVDLSAPAVGIPVARTRSGGVMDLDVSMGTSYACALTTGAAALWTARHGTAGLAQRYPQPWQRVEAFLQTVRDTASRPPQWQVDAGFGAGVLDVLPLLQAPLPPAAGLRQQPAA